MTLALPERPAPAHLPAARPATIDDKLAYCRALAVSGMLPKAFRQQPGNLLYAVEYADSLGLHPMVAITGIHVIEGKPSASAALISALVRRAGHTLRVKGDAKQATAQIIRTDDREWTFEVTFTIDDARNAGLLGKDVWKKYPASMLKARAISAVARDACEEALFGVHYTPEELGAVVDQEGNPVYTGADVQRDNGEQAPAAPQRDYLAEAREAVAADHVVAIYRDAQAVGAPDDYLDQLRTVGAELRAAEQAEAAAGPTTPPPSTPESGTAADAATAPAMESPLPDADERAAAVGPLYAAARAAGLSEAEADETFRAAHGCMPADATTDQLNVHAADLRAAVEGEQ